MPQGLPTFFSSASSRINVLGTFSGGLDLVQAALQEMSTDRTH